MALSIFRVLLLLPLLSLPVTAIKCYQCSSDQDKNGDDVCGVYGSFDKERNVAVECNTEEANVPGIFCVKIIQQGPRGFIWDGRWRQVIRRCASVSETGVTGYCNWGHYDNGVYWEECYCSHDECNSASSLYKSLAVFFASLVVSAVMASSWFL